MYASENTEHYTTDNNIVKVRNNKVSIMILVVCGCSSEHYASNPSHKKGRDKSKSPVHRSSKFDTSPPHCEQPVENLDTRWYPNCHCCNSKNSIRNRS